MIRASSPTRNSAGQTRLPTFSITSRSSSSSGSAGSAERTMLASRWHSPPKPASVLSCTTGTCRRGEAVGVEAALHVALEHARAHAARGPARARARAASSCPRPGALIRFTTVTPARSKSSRLARAIVLLASSASSTTRTFTRCMRCLLLDLDRLDLELVAADAPSTAAPRARRAAERGHVDRPLARARRRSAAAPGRARARAARPRRAVLARDDLEVERERVRAPPGAACPTRRCTHGHAPARRVAHDGVDDGGADRQLVHPLPRVRRVGAQLVDGLAHQRRSRRSTAALDRRASARARRRRPRLARSAITTHLARPAADGVDEAQHRLRVHVVRVDASRRPRSSPPTSSRSGSIT